MDPQSPPRLLDQLRGKIRMLHYSIRTEQTYLDWARRFIRFHGLRHPRDLGAKAVEAFLTHLAVERNVSASTQNQAKSAILFLYREVLEMELEWLDDVTPAKTPARLPVVLTRDETERVLAVTEDVPGLILRLLYGAGLRLLEAMRLRVKDLDLVRREILVREGKGGKDRVTVVPATLVPSLRDQLSRVRILHQPISP